MNIIKYSIVIPCYNEEKNIPIILNRFNEVIDRDDIEVILVNNGSTDNSEKVFNDLIPKYSFAKVVKVDINQGYGYGILTGLNEAKGQFIGWTHGDVQTDPKDVIAAIELIDKENNPLVFVKGNRNGRKLFDEFFTFSMGCFETLLLGKVLWDINAQPNMFSRALFDSWKNPPYDFSLDLFAFYQAKKQGYTVKRIPVIFPERINGVSSWNTGLMSKFKLIKRTIDFSFKLKKGLNK